MGNEFAVSRYLQSIDTIISMNTSMTIPSTLRTFALRCQCYDLIQLVYCVDMNSQAQGNRAIHLPERNNTQNQI